MYAPTKPTNAPTISTTISVINIVTCGSTELSERGPKTPYAASTNNGVAAIAPKIAPHFIFLAL